MARLAAWDPAQYLRWSDHRIRPAVDLIQRVPLPQPAHIVDLGCGTGNVTALLRGAWPTARVTGVDASASMLERARASDPGVDWQQAEIAGWTPATPVDLLFSNAALHWLDHHDTLFPRLLDLMAPGGVLAVQMPRNFGEPSHTSIADLAREARWKARLAPLVRAEPCKTPAYYFDLLAARTKALDIWETVYEQALTGDNPVADFVKGSWLKPFLDALDEGAERTAFETAYREKIARAYPARPDGITLFPFRRLFIVARC